MRLLAATVVAFVVATHPYAQARPDFSGSWVITQQPTGLLGEKFVAVQSEKALTLTITVAALSRDVKVVYNLDGSESKNMNPRGPGVDDEPIFSRASWEADKLIVNTRGTVPVDGRIVESRRVIWIGPDGLLTIERTAAGAAPVRSVYQRAKAPGR
jgi:hypothetical protein